MKRLDIDTVAGLLDGHIDLRRRHGAIQPLRYLFADNLFLDPFTRWVASCAAGVRLRLETDARTLRLSTTQRSLEDRAVNYELCVDGELFERKPAIGGARIVGAELMGDEQAVLQFGDPPTGVKRIELWLPQTATVSITGFEIDDGAHVAPWPDQRRTVLFHGSSITHCMEADGGSGAWPAVATALGNLRAVNMGWAGSCLLSGLAARAIRDQAADGIVLKLGINVHGDGALKERTFLDSAHAMISIIRERHAQTPLMIVSPIFSPPREDVGDRGGLSLKRMRELLEAVVRARRSAGDARISQLSGLALFGEADASDLPDELHPNAAGYRRMGERFHAQVLADGRWLAGEALG
jgi:lysophospholipase L1-like esterase